MKVLTPEAAAAIWTRVHAACEFVLGQKILTSTLDGFKAALDAILVDVANHGGADVLRHLEFELQVNAITRCVGIRLIPRPGLGDSDYGEVQVFLHGNPE